MKSAQQIAQTLLNRRNAMNPVVMQGEMLVALESEGLQEALQRRWLVPDESSGYLMVSQDMSKVQEMQAVAEAKDGDKDKDKDKDKEKDEEDEEWTKPWEKPNESRAYSMQHSHRPISELLSPSTGHDSGGGLTSGTSPTSSVNPMRTPPPPAAPTSPPQPGRPGGMAKPGVGDDVAVVPATGAGAAESQAFTGKVSSTADGRVKISFGGEEHDYAENEVQIIKKAGLPGGPQAAMPPR